MQTAAGSKIVLPLYTSSVAICSLFMLGAMLLSPSEPGNTVAFGLSLPRLALAAGFLFVFVLFSALSYKGIKDRGWAERTLEQWFGGGRFSGWLAWSAAIGLGLGWIGCFLPPYRAGVLEPHWNRIQPLLIFILAVSIATLAVFFVKRSGLPGRTRKSSDVFRLGFILFITSLPILILMLSSEYDAYRLEDHWYGAGVPLLPSQLILAGLGGVLFLRLGRSWISGRADLVIFILLYAVTAVLWAGEPLEKSFLFIGPYPPNDVLYPFADAATFDLASQFGLIGQGIYIFHSPFFERALYLSFLIYLHSLVGQNYETLMAVQAATFAVLPPLIYLIGRSLNMRAVGFSAAMIAMLRGVNSIAASNLIDQASPKMILTDFPSAIGLALIVLFACEWLRDTDRKWHYALWTGGAVGLTVMLRTNGLVFLPLIPLFALLKYALHWKKWLAASALVWLAVLATTLPWELRNVARGETLYGPIVMKIENVIRTRYPLPSDSSAPQERILSLLVYQQTRPLTYLPAEPYLQEGLACQTIACFAPKHFVHNVNMSILLLPASPVLHDLWHTVKDAYPFWRANWGGDFSPASLFFFTLNVFILLLGISVAWKEQRIPGMVPLAVFVIYNVSNAFARTSGGRYIVPVDWVIPFYFVAGILFLIVQAAAVTRVRLNPLTDPGHRERHQTRQLTSPLAMTVLILLVLFGAGSLVPLAEKIHRPRYADFNFAEALREHESQIASAGLTTTQVNAFLELPGSEMLVGRTLYPRSYRSNQGEIAFYPYTVMGFPRTGFVLAGPEGSDAVVLPGGVPEYFPHAQDALVIGCREAEYVDALAVILLDDTRTVYTRSPMPELTCPLQLPVCENNNVCE